MLDRARRYGQATLAELRKDLRLEWRSKDALNSMLFLALLVVVLFSLAFDPTRAEARQIASGVLCVAILFAATGALNQAWTRELRGGVLDAQRKTLASFLFVSAVELLLAPLFVIFYNLDPQGNPWMLLLVLPLGTWALVGNGVFFAALSLRARSRELLLPLLLFPIFIPALLAMTSGAAAVFTGDNDPKLWVKLLAGYDVIFTTAALLLFGTVLNSEA